MRTRVQCLATQKATAASRLEACRMYWVCAGSSTILKHIYDRWRRKEVGISNSAAVVLRVDSDRIPPNDYGDITNSYQGQTRSSFQPDVQTLLTRLYRMLFSRPRRFPFRSVISQPPRRISMTPTNVRTYHIPTQPCPPGKVSPPGAGEHSYIIVGARVQDEAPGRISQMQS